MAKKNKEEYRLRNEKFLEDIALAPMPPLSVDTWPSEPAPPAIPPAPPGFAAMQIMDCYPLWGCSERPGSAWPLDEA